MVRPDSCGCTPWTQEICTISAISAPSWYVFGLSERAHKGWKSDISSHTVTSLSFVAYGTTVQNYKEISADRDDGRRARYGTVSHAYAGHDEEVFRNRVDVWRRRNFLSHPAQGVSKLWAVLRAKMKLALVKHVELRLNQYEEQVDALYWVRHMILMSRPNFKTISVTKWEKSELIEPSFRACMEPNAKCTIVISIVNPSKNMIYLWRWTSQKLICWDFNIYVESNRRNRDRKEKDLCPSNPEFPVKQRCWFTLMRKCSGQLLPFKRNSRLCGAH